MGRLSKKLVLALGFGIGLSACAKEEVGGSEREIGSVAEGLRARVPDAELKRMSAWLKGRYDHADVVDTIVQGEDLFDCIPREKQESVRALRAAGHKVAFPLGPNIEPPGFRQALEEPESAAECPPMHVPVRRITLSEVASAGTLDEYLYKAPRPRMQEPEPAKQLDNRDYATVGKAEANYGAESIINLWEPVVSGSDQTISQIWVGYPGSPETVEVGWRRYTSTGSTRLFVFSRKSSTSAGYGTSGGFVQTNTSIALDTTFSAVSVSGGAQHERKMTLWKDGDTGEWWFGYGPNWIGYWPHTQYTTGGIATKAGDYIFGGEVYDEPGGNHTTTDMGGDGSYAAGGYTHAAYQRNLTVFKIVGGFIDAVDAPVAIYKVTQSACYNISLTKNTANSWRHWIYFGGPGYNTATGCLNP